MNDKMMLFSSNITNNQYKQHQDNSEESSSFFCRLNMVQQWKYLVHECKKHVSDYNNNITNK